MRKLKSIFLAAALTLCGAGLCVMNNALVAKAETETAQATVLSDFNCSYSAQKAGGYMAYGSSEIVTYSAAEAAPMTPVWILLSISS